LWGKVGGCFCTISGEVQEQFQERGEPRGDTRQKPPQGKTTERKPKTNKRKNAGPKERGKEKIVSAALVGGKGGDLNTSDEGKKENYYHTD